MQKKVILIVSAIVIIGIAFFSYEYFSEQELSQKKERCLNTHNLITQYVQNDERLNDQRYNTIEDLFYSEKKQSCLYFMKSTFVWANWDISGEWYELIDAWNWDKDIVTRECWYEKEGNCENKEKAFKKIIEDYK